MEKKSQDPLTDATKLLQRFPEELRPRLQEWFDDQLDYLVPREWRDDFQSWKLERLEGIVDDKPGIALLQRLHSHHPTCLGGVLEQVSMYWCLFRERRLIPTNWDPKELDGLGPLVARDIAEYGKAIPREHVEIVLRALQDLLKNPQSLRQGSGRIQMFYEKIFVSSVKWHLRDAKISKSNKAMADLIRLFHPDEFSPGYPAKRVADLLRGLWD